MKINYFKSLFISVWVTLLFLYWYIDFFRVKLQSKGEFLLFVSPQGGSGLYFLMLIYALPLILILSLTILACKKEFFNINPQWLFALSALATFGCIVYVSLSKFFLVHSAIKEINQSLLWSTKIWWIFFGIFGYSYVFQQRMVTLLHLEDFFLKEREKHFQTIVVSFFLVCLFLLFCVKVYWLKYIISKEDLLFFETDILLRWISIFFPYLIFASYISFLYNKERFLAIVFNGFFGFFYITAVVSLGSHLFSDISVKFSMLLSLLFVLVLHEFLLPKMYQREVY